MSNNGLYFLTGGLLVAVVALAAYFFTTSEKGEEVVRETNTVIEKTVENEDKEGSSFSLSVDEEGFSASSENNN